MYINKNLSENNYSEDLDQGNKNQLNGSFLKENTPLLHKELINNICENNSLTIPISSLLESLLQLYSLIPIRVFFCIDSSDDTFFTLSFSRNISWEDFIKLSSEKAGKEIEFVQHKESKARINRLDELRDNDYLRMISSNKKNTSSKLCSSHSSKSISKSSINVKSVRGKKFPKNTRIKTKSSSLNNINSFFHFVASLEKDINDKLKRRRSLSDLYAHRIKAKKDVSKKELRHIDRNLKIKKNTLIINYHPGTRINRNNYDTKLLLQELKRSKSLPHVLLHYWHESTKNTIEIQEEQPNYNINGNLFGFTNMKDINPLKVSYDELYERMMEEEKQDHVNISFSQDGEVESGTLRALVRHLTSHLQDPEFVDAFLLTYDLYIDHNTLLNAFILLYRLPLSTSDSIKQLQTSRSQLNKERIRSATFDQGFNMSNELRMTERMKIVIQHRIVSVISQWIKLRYQTLKSRRRFFNLFSEFCEYLSKSSNVNDKKNQSRLKLVLKDTKKKIKKIKTQLELSKPIISGNTIKECKTITEISPIDIAKQLTLGDQYIFGRIKLSEYISSNFSGTNKERKAPNIMKFIERFNKMSYWVATCIIFSNGTSKDRSKIISHFILVLDELKKLQSYNSMMQIYSALNMSCVLKLQKAWSYVPSKHREILDNVASLFSLNYKGYREIIELAEPPCIPIQEIVLRDITFIEENPTVFDNGWINFSKLRFLGKTYKLLNRFQSVQYDFTSNDQIQFYIDSHVNLTENELYDRAVKLEDQERNEEAKKKKMRSVVKRSVSVAEFKTKNSNHRK